MNNYNNSFDVTVSNEQFEFETENAEPIQILVFPPKNKKFRIDENAQCLQLEPANISKNESVTDSAGPGFLSNDITEEKEKLKIELKTDQPADNGKSCERCDECQNIRERESIEMREVLKIYTPFRSSNCFLKGCKWSPDGFCLLSNSEDNTLRLFEIPESIIHLTSKHILPALVAKEGGTVYDFEWYPKMCSSDPVTCVFASTSQSSPIHLWDAYTGHLRATYQPINQYDEVTAAYSLAFSPDGSKLYSGFKKCLRIFDLHLPGRVSEERNLKIKGDSVFQTNIISCISVNKVVPSVYALGSYDKTLGLYTEPEGKLQCLLKGHVGGVTHIMFSHDGFCLYSGGRKDSEILCWDLRNPGKILFIVKREVSTNQRIYFDLSSDGTYLVTGSTDGRIMVYNTKTGKSTDDRLEPEIAFTAHEDCVNGVHFHPFRPMMASSSGQYHRPNSTLDEDDTLTDPSRSIDNSLKIWSVNFGQGKES